MCFAGLLIVMFNPLFKLANADLPAPVILFATFGGLRGAVSLILAQMLVTQQDQIQKSRDMLQTAQVILCFFVTFWLVFVASPLHHLCITFASCFFVFLCFTFASSLSS